jgi:hypothetical protein
LELRSEFAHVRVELDESANGPRLMIEDLKTGQRVYLDPLELESLAWADHAELAPLLNPAVRWDDRPGLRRPLRGLGLDLDAR